MTGSGEGHPLASDDVIVVDGHRFKTFKPFGRTQIEDGLFSRVPDKTTLMGVGRHRRKLVHVMGVLANQRGAFSPDTVVLIGRIDGAHEPAPIKLQHLVDHQSIMNNLNSLSL